MLCRMAIKNIKKSVRDYAIYFFTLVIGVSVFYVFNAIEDQASYMVVSKDTREMARILGTVLSCRPEFGRITFRSEAFFVTACQYYCAKKRKYIKDFFHKFVDFKSE